MLRLILVALVGLILGIAAYKFFAPSAEVSSNAPFQLTPDERFLAVARAGAANAEELGALSDNYPALAAKYLKDVPLRITGTVQRMFVSGMGERRAALELHRAKQRSLLVVYDLDHYAVLPLSPVNDRNWKFVIVGSELLLVDSDKHRRANLFHARTAYESPVIFNRVTASSVLLDAPQLPSPHWQEN